MEPIKFYNNDLLVQEWKDTGRMPKFQLFMRIYDRTGASYWDATSRENVEAEWDCDDGRGAWFLQFRTSRRFEFLDT